MKRFVNVLLNPFLLSLWVTLPILLIFLPKIDKYLVTLAESGTNLNKRIIYYDDLDNDGTSEKIAIFHNSLGNAGLTIDNVNGVLDQWNFYGTIHFAMQTGIVITGDRNNDKIKEIYLFTASHDSVFLHVMPDYKNPKLILKNRFIARVGKRDGKTDPFIIHAEMQDINGDKIKELIFGIGTGYSIYPRKVFAYDCINDTLYASPESGYFISGILQEDIDGDKVTEIIPHGYASGNVHQSEIPYPDSCSWLMVLNQQLQFVFDPLFFPGSYSSLSPAIMHDDKLKPVLIALYCLPQRSGSMNILMRFDKDGHIEKKIFVPRTASEIMTVHSRNNHEKLVLCRQSEGYDFYDEELRHLKFIPARVTGNHVLVDLDLDGDEEVINIDVFHRKLNVFRSNLDHPVSMDIRGEGEGGINYSLFVQKGKAPQFFVQMGNDFFLYNYVKNPAYSIRFIMYMAIYMAVLLFSFLVRRIQREQIQKKQETARKINQLQLQLIRNQLDPHFIMNAINSIIASITDQDKEEARQQLFHFSKLHRSLLLSSDQIQQSLHEEISFTENYLALEKFRFRNKFDYHIQIGQGVNQDIMVPKMILQIYVENSLKHGIAPLEKKGLLTIAINTEQEHLVITITDNGVGREYARSHNVGTTGRGMAVMEQYVELYNKYYPGKIRLKTEDLYDSAHIPQGTMIIITISYERKSSTTQHSKLHNY